MVAPLNFDSMNKWLALGTKIDVAGLIVEALIVEALGEKILANQLDLVFSVALAPNEIGAE
ncbi:MAG: hypothetical protein R3C51_01155 [Parvularculaceae bacterium]